MKTIVKLIIVSSKNGQFNSNVKRIRLGDSFEVDKDCHIEKITLSNVRMIYSETDDEQQ